MIYLLMTIISIIFAELYYYYKNNKLKKVFLFLSIIPFFLISALRYDIGTDYFYRYVPDFLQIASGGTVNNLEIGFQILYKILAFFSENPQIVFIVTSGLIIIPLFLTIFKYSKRPSISILLFFVGAFFFISLNMIRQFLAITILFSSLPLLKEKKYIKWLLTLVLAMCVHKTAIVFGIVLLFTKKFICSPIVLFVIATIVFLFKNELNTLINTILLYTSFSHYAYSQFATMDLQWTPLIINTLIYLYMYYIYKKQKVNSDNLQNDILLLNIQGFSIFLLLMGGVFSIILRLVYFFTIFQIISLVNFFYKKPETKLKIALIFIIAIMSLGVIKTHFIANNDEVFPYKSIFDKNKTLVVDIKTYSEVNI